MERVDAHVHAFPDRLALAVRGRLGANGQLTAGVLLQDVAHMVRAAGFGRAWVLPYAHRAGIAVSVNEWSAREIGQFPWLVPGATFHPDDDNLSGLVERALVDLRLKVVKLHCSVGGFSPADPRLEPLWATASEAKVPVVIHAGQRSPGDTAPDEVEELGPVLASHPGLRIVLAHAGHPSTGSALRLMSRFPNLYADLTPVWDRPVAIGPGEIRRFPERFLFGSDAPNNPVPVVEQENRLREMGLGRGELDQLMGGNAESLLA
jgi:predicted TIM-barrel fold metal-dependent hydrolase